MDLSSLTGMFVGLHLTLATLTKTPELKIEPDEGKAFMNAAQNVLRHYSVQTTQKTLDWIALFGVAGGIYGTRAFAIAMRREQERKEEKPMHFRRREYPPHLRPVENVATSDIQSTGPATFEPSAPPGDYEPPTF